MKAHKRVDQWRGRRPFSQDSGIQSQCRKYRETFRIGDQKKSYCFDLIGIRMEDLGHRYMVGRDQHPRISGKMLNLVSHSPWQVRETRQWII